MFHWIGTGMLLAAVVDTPAAVAQLPMSPVFRTETEMLRYDAEKAGSPAAENAPAKAEPGPEERASSVKSDAVEQKPVATAPIPPPSRDTGKDRGSLESASRPASTAAAPASDTAAPLASHPSAPTPKEDAAGAAAAETSASSSKEAPAGQAAETPLEDPKKTTARKGGRQARASRHARRPGSVYYRPPTASYAPSPYSGASRGYGGGAYGPSPYSSDGP